MRAHDLRDGTRSESAVASHLANSSNDGRRRRLCCECKSDERFRSQKLDARRYRLPTRLLAYLPDRPACLNNTPLWKGTQDRFGIPVKFPAEYDSLMPYQPGNPKNKKF